MTVILRGTVVLLEDYDGMGLIVSDRSTLLNIFRLSETEN